MNKIFPRSQYTVYYRAQHEASSFQIETSTDYAALFVLDGAVRCSLEENKFVSAATHDALLFNPGPTVSAQVETRHTQLLLLTIKPIYLLDCAVRTGFASGRDLLISFRAPVITGDAKALRIAHDLADELRQDETGQEAAVAAMVEQLLVHLLRRHSNARRADELELSRAGGLVDRRIRRAVELMHANLDQDLPLDALAAAAYLSSFHFARLFKKLTGATPHAYLAALRIARARDLLAATDLSITEIAARVGYATPSHFTKAFRRSTGLTPRAFRTSIVRGK